MLTAICLPPSPNLKNLIKLIKFVEQVTKKKSSKTMMT